MALKYKISQSFIVVGMEPPYCKGVPLAGSISITLSNFCLFYQFFILIDGDSDYVHHTPFFNSKAKNYFSVLLVIFNSTSRGLACPFFIPITIAGDGDNIFYFYTIDRCLPIIVEDLPQKKFKSFVLTHVRKFF